MELILKMLMIQYSVSNPSCIIVMTLGKAISLSMSFIWYCESSLEHMDYVHKLEEWKDLIILAKKHGPFDDPAMEGFYNFFHSPITCYPLE